METLLDLMNGANLNIEDKYIKKYTELVVGKEDYATFIKNIACDLLKKINMNDKIEYNIENLLNTTVQNRRKTKKRWIDGEVLNNSSLQVEIQKQAIALYKKDRESFNLTYKADSIEELKKDMERLQDVKNEKTKAWYKDDNAYVVDFDCLTDKKVWQIIQAFQSDFTYTILKNVKNLINVNNTLSMPIVMGELPVDIGGRRKISLDTMPFITTHDNNKEEVYYHDIEKFQDLQINTYIGMDYVQKYCLNNAFKHLNATDKKILGFILSKRKGNFFETRQIIVDLSDIIKNVFETDGIKNYNTVKESIVKMANIKMQFIVKGLSGFISRIFTEVFFTERDIDEGKKSVFTTATIFVSDIIVNQLMQQQTMYTYGDKLSDVSSEAFSLICALQGRRMKLYGENKNILKDILPYYFFQIRFRMSDKRKKRNLTIIQNLLEEVKNNNIIIKDFEKIADDFHVSYYPLSIKEINKFDDTEEQLYLLPIEE